MATLKLGGIAEKDIGTFILPVSGATGIYFTNASNLKLQNNFATGNLENIVTGLPVINDDFTSLSQNDGLITTKIEESSDMTMFAVYNHPTFLSSSGAMIFSNYGDTTGSYGTGLQITNKEFVSFIASNKKSTGLTAGIQSVNAQGWTLVCGKAQGATNKVYNLTTGLQKEADYIERVLPSNSVNMRIGGAYANSFSDKLDVMCVVCYDRALTDAEVEKVSKSIKKYAQHHGVNV